jgi:hypothetical protein
MSPGNRTLTAAGLTLLDDSGNRKVGTAEDCCCPPEYPCDQCEAGGLASEDFYIEIDGTTLNTTCYDANNTGEDCDLFDGQAAKVTSTTFDGVTEIVVWQSTFGDGYPSACCWGRSTLPITYQRDSEPDNLCPLTTPTTVNDSGTLLVAITSDTIRVFVMISYLGAQILVFYGEAAFDCTSTTPIELENQLSTFTGQECFGWDYYA